MAKKSTITLKDLKGNMSVFNYVRPYMGYLIGGLILLTLSSLLFMILPGAAGEMANAANGEPKYDITVRQYGYLFAVILIIQGLISYFRTILFAQVSERGMGDVRKAVFQKLITQEVPYFEQFRVGELSSRITSDVEKLQSAFSITLAEFLRQIIILIVGIGILVVTAPQLSMIMLATIPLIVVIAVVFGRYIRKMSKKRQEAIAESNTIVEETFQSFHMVKAFVNEYFESLRYEGSINNIVSISLKFARTKGLFFVFMVTFLFGGMFFVLWRGALLVEQGEFPIGDLFSFIIYTGILGGAIASLGNLYAELASALGATERIREILDRPSELEPVKVDTSHRVTGEVRFDNVQFTYPSRPDVEVLKGISFTVLPGQKVAVVGQSGAGKSTIMSLLLRYYDPSSGQLLVDNKPIETYDLGEYRHNFAIVPQEVILFGGTIGENILYGKPDASPMAIQEAAEQANAWEFISKFPDGLDTIVGERGIKLSGGQRQRIAIARAILRDPAILLLDEATSSLDAESEATVQDALQTLMHGRTSIIIAHRLATVRDVDQIFVLDNGEIVESGTHDELIHQDDGYYQRLARLQFDIEA